MLYRFAPVLLLGACGWPNYANFPDDVYVDAADNPASMVNIAWTEFQSEVDALAEGGTDNADPRDVSAVPVGLFQGALLTGELRGVGWNADFESIEYDNGDGCTGGLSTGRAGDWAGDLDFVVVKVDDAAEAPVLCARVVQPVADLGWELVAYPLNECGLPMPPLEGPGGVLGLDLGGVSGGWKTPVDAGKTYGVLLAGYDPGPDDGAELTTFDYQIGVSVIKGADGAELCPLLMGEATQ